ncbi:hypothetical protein SCLCIDRAFT_1209074 [Scleroderma citrinum Foug A]|uniref:Uncharacterized protein n=1 Tax=Scleroderma citrinum Foug A TaxID=1036808 RepID=A0A0C3E7W6_9AGAM|nr:hypothetical protein SCLCIDRAFT_1209074 [Scleroderma citrinum Foug A]
MDGKYVTCKGLRAFASDSHLSELNTISQEPTLKQPFPEMSNAQNTLSPRSRINKAQQEVSNSFPPLPYFHSF